MSNQNIVISFTSDDTSDDTYLLLEQQDYPETDQLTMLGVARLLKGVVSQLTTVDTNTCIMSADGTSFTTTVLAYPSPANLVYSTNAVNGTVSVGGSGLVTKTELIKFSLSNTATIKYPVHTFISGEWLSGVYNSDGQLVPAPVVERNGNTLRTATNVWGTYKVKYRVWEDKFNVNVNAIVGSVENFFQSVFYASFDYGIELLDLDPPPNAEENYSNSVDCNGYPIGWDYSANEELVVIDDDDPTSVPKAYPVNEVISLDYCKDFGNE